MELCYRWTRKSNFGNSLELKVGIRTQVGWRWMVELLDI